MHGVLGMAKKAPPPPPPKGKKAPPPPPPPAKKKAPPPPKGKKAPPPPKPPSDADIKKQIAAAVEAEDFELAAKLKKSLPSTKKKAPAPPPAKKKAPPSKPPMDPPKQKPRKPPTKAKKKQAPKQKPKKGRRIRIKNKLRQTRIREESDTTAPQDIGWSISQDTMDDFDEPQSTEPEIVSHQCTMCGSIMQIPAPKRDRYKVICAYPECGHEDTFGI